MPNSVCLIKQKAVVLFFCLLVMNMIFSINAYGADNIVVVLDPGHDKLHAGAREGNLIEESLSLKIAQYCKNELEQYEGVTVYMTREKEDCPFPGLTSVLDNRSRVYFAQSKGADAYVALHLNWAYNPEARGVEVYYPNRNWKPGIGDAGKALASAILPNVVALGLESRGIQIRNSEDGTKYEDGSLADYYGVINRAKICGFPAVIVEHAFLTNGRDAVFLSQEENLKKLGIADATGIAFYFNLSRKPLVPFGEPAEADAYGNVNMDSVIDASDALSILQFVVRLEEPTEQQIAAADVDGSGEVDVEDALLVLEKAVRLIEKFPVEE